MKLDLQKASLWKRFSAFLFDVIMLGLLVVGVGFMMSGALHYDEHINALTGAYDRYEAEYDVEFQMTREQYESLPQEDRDRFDAAYDALIHDEPAMHEYGLVINLTLLIISLSLLIGFAVMEFAIPLWLKNGQTLGKRIFGVALMHTSGIRITPMLLFIRTILGKYTLETMVPVLILLMIFFGTVGRIGLFVLIGILALEVILMATTRTNSMLHDVLAKTVAVDMSSQWIFRDGAELLEYKKKLHAEEVERQSY